MSDNKYIIDKDSLTGIADAVRDKLGVGEATTDPQTGNIVYPEGKGYYTDTENVDYIAVSDYESKWSNGTWQKELVSFPSPATYANYVEKPVSQVEIEGYFYWYSMTCKIIVNFAEDSQQFPLKNDSTTLQKFTCTFDTPRSYLRIWFQATNQYTREQFASVKGVRVLLKDENGDPIKLISSSFPVTKDGTTCLVDTVSQEVQKPIPYSVADIKNNIKDYWNIPEGSLNISANGTYDVTNKAEAVVNVPNPSTGSLEITENGTYDVTDKASAIVNVSSGGGLPPFTVPTVKQKVLQWEVPSQSDFSSIFSTQEEMLEHLIDIIPDRGMYAGKIAGKWISLPVFKDKYGRWIPLKKMGVILPTRSFDIGKSWASLGLTETVIQNLYNNNLVFGCSSVTDYADQGGHWYIIFDRYIVCCCREFVGLNSDNSYVLYTEV